MSSLAAVAFTAQMFWKSPIGDTGKRNLCHLNWATLLLTETPNADRRFAGLIVAAAITWRIDIPYNKNVSRDNIGTRLNPKIENKDEVPKVFQQN